ncbi:MAG: type II secretion system F family protein [Gammaproteobacteria bacterium]|nr:type II secretion system F family protein [Gammaproteobacteria bacterium]MBU1406535.1 type II secretion system F family protein [Gammaproteobacteria bacterium]MBU1530843.1 type II secretion system F family protein [Gammaproteobacteria bacterium]
MTQTLYLVLVFIAVFVAALTILLQLVPHPTQTRLDHLAGEAGNAPQKSESSWVERIVKLTGPFAKLSLPTEGWEDSRLRIHFMNAGYRNSAAPLLFFAAKTILTFALPAVFLLTIGLGGADLKANMIVTLLVGLAALGYFLPNAFLQQRIAHRKREIFESFPDALDLTTVCVEAGLGLDAALSRVGDEMRLKSTPLAEELHLVTLELRAGSSRERALRNLALRTGVEEIDALVAMLVQADRFGTTVADSLRVHSDSLRTKRRLRAEEAAAKIPVKLLFPLIFCIFPSMLLVLLGPAFISVYRVLLPTFAGQAG